MSKKIPECSFCGRIQILGILQKMKQELKKHKSKFGEDSPIYRGYKGAIKDFEKLLKGSD